METIRSVETPSVPSTATVVDLTQESDTIKRLVLQVDDPSVSFKAGQWVDFYIPGVSIFTGYSMCSPPHLLKETGRMELAVKYSDYPPTLWVHTKCKVGDKVKVKVAGSLFYEPTPQAPGSDVLLLAAGIGINPIYSIYRHFIHVQQQQPQQTNRHGGGGGDSDSSGRLCLLYSAQTPRELVFKDEILQMATVCSSVHVQLFSTRKDPKTDNSISHCRITAQSVKAHIAKLEKAGVQAYICGPPSFIDDMETLCLQEGVASTHIHYEKWW